MNDKLLIKTISELREFEFFVPAYQRGFRWNKSEVLDLLNDINEFNPTNIGDSAEKSWYCLQPIVLKNINGVFEVIDGQQRLTTIFLILHYLNFFIVEHMRKRIFGINYQTQENLPTFLNNLSSETLSDETPDCFYLSQAYSSITNWFNKKDFDIFGFQSKFEFSTKVIWFESTEEDPIQIFTRINIGKIPLTNSELIKALFMNRSNFKNSNPEKIKLKQLEISGEWDRIEQGLQDDSFWYFLTNGEREQNRIDYIFNIMNPNRIIDDKLSTFRFFATKLQKIDEDILDVQWLEVKNYYQRFHEWYSERDLFHKIGFLITVGYKITDILSLSKKKTKKEFIKGLDAKIEHHFEKIKLSELQYGDKIVKDVILLYNIQTMLNNSTENSRFPFDIFKSKNWDIEHITSVKDKMPDSETNQKQWLLDATAFIEDESLKKTASDFVFSKGTDFSILYDEIINYFNDDIKETDINDISNLALLDAETNRSYKNAVFPVKRATIIKKEKSGGFIPLCTKNAFLKYFSDYPPKISFWTQDDRENYYKDMSNVLSVYLSKEE